MKKFIEWIKRKKRKKKFKVHFDNDSFCIKDYKMAPVHLITEEILDNKEFDFYILTNYDTYLLRLIKSNEESGIIYPTKDDGLIYIVCKLPFNKATIIDTIDKTLNALREGYHFPKLKSPTLPIKLSIDKSFR